MVSRSRAALILTGGVLFAWTGPAADRRVDLKASPPLRQNLASMPQIASPSDAAENRINAALSRLDATVRKAVGDCKASDGKPGSWERTVDAPMRGPGYLSFVITDSTYCGGAHPDVSTMSIVYDLGTGNPVDWTRLLPDELTGTLALQQGADGTRMVTLASRRLFDLYLTGYRAGDTSTEAQECRQAVADSTGNDPPPMMAWLDAKGGGLAVQFDLPHAVQACEAVVVIPAATLRAEGAKPVLVDAIQAAR